MDIFCNHEYKTNKFQLHVITLKKILKYSFILRLYITVQVEEILNIITF